MRSSDEIKKGLQEAPHVKYVVDDPSRNDVHYERYGVAIGYILRDQIYIYITQLEQRLAQAERERDAAVHDISEASYFQCRVCKHGDWPNCKKGRNNVVEDDICKCELFEWRGVVEENSHE